MSCYLVETYELFESYEEGPPCIAGLEFNAEFFLNLTCEEFLKIKEEIKEKNCELIKRREDYLKRMALETKEKLMREQEMSEFVKTYCAEGVE